MANYQPQVMQPGMPGTQMNPSGPNAWMPLPAAPSGCPPGLEYLTLLDQVLVKQQVELLEAFTGFETKNKYIIKNSLGQQVYFAAEDTDCCTRNLCGTRRPFQIQIFDNARQEVMHLSRPLRCDSCFFPCCLQVLTVEAPPGTVIGYVKQNCTVCYPQFRVEDANENTVLKIGGPLCQCSCFGSVDFNVTSADGNMQVGVISKQWSGMLKEAFTDADNFCVTFPLDLDIKFKAILLGALFMIDFMFFESDK